jgi:hypothetical protein
VTVVGDYGSLPGHPYAELPELPEPDPGRPEADATAPAPVAAAPGFFIAYEPPIPAPLDTPARHAERRRRTRPPGVLIAAGAVVVVVGAGALVAGFMGGDSEDEVLPRPQVTDSLPVVPTGDGEATPTATGTPSRPVRASASPVADGGADASATPSSEAASSGASSNTSRRPTTAPDGGGSGPVLQLGSSGDEVVELQERLRQLGMYQGAADGDYDASLRAAVARFQRNNGISGDSSGVYGPETRRVLEGATREP